MKILFAASEMTPYAKTGGLGDVIGALPGTLSRLGHEVTCCLPYYRCVRLRLEQMATAGQNPVAPGRALPHESAEWRRPDPVAPTKRGGCSGSALPTATTATGTIALPKPLQIQLGEKMVTGEVLEWKQADGVRMLFVKCDEFFDREDLYGEENRDYDDNAERFLFFSKAVVELANDARYRPDVVHCHDWQTAAVPVLMGEREDQQPQAGTLAPPRIGKAEPVAPSLLSGLPQEKTDRGGDAAPTRKEKPVAPPARPKTVFTIHNLAFQGIFPVEKFPLTNLPEEFFAPAALEFYGRMNLMKGGLVYADAVTTVSPTYAKEIQTTVNGFGLDGVLKTRAEVLRGILNGVDYEHWNPATDELIKERYNIDHLAGKEACRADLLERMGLEGSGFKVQGSGLQAQDSGFGEGGKREATKKETATTGRDACATSTQQRRPVLGFVSRLTEQKGVEVLAAAIEELVEAGAVLAMLGKGEHKYEEMLQETARRFPGRVAVEIAHDEELAHKIQAGADILLVPSRFEPCGLTQLYALKYGTIPVVRATGGLEDTVVQYEEQPQAETPAPPKRSPQASGSRHQQGTGFKFALYESEALVEAVRRAILLHNQPEKWQKLMRNAMACDFSWQASAREYEKLYAAL